MVCQKVKIKNPAGLHLRQAGKLCDEELRTGQRFHSRREMQRQMQKAC